MEENRYLKIGLSNEKGSVWRYRRCSDYPRLHSEKRARCQISGCSLWFSRALLPLHNGRWRCLCVAPHGTNCVIIPSRCLPKAFFETGGRPKVFTEGLLNSSQLQRLEKFVAGDSYCYAESQISESSWGWLWFLMNYIDWAINHTQI